MKVQPLNQVGFDRLLTALDVDREKAGLEYERVRGRLVIYFQARDVAQAEDAADESLNRVVAKLSAGEEIRDPVQYVFGVARVVLLEIIRQRARQGELKDYSLAAPKQEEEDEDVQARIACLRHCLQGLTADQRDLITQYYEEEKRAKINLRQQLAERFGIDLNTLRVRACRLRDNLKSCVRKCVAGQKRV